MAASFGNYQLLDTLGQGTFGRVVLGYQQNNYYALKFSTTNQAYSSQVLQSIFQKQSAILQQLSHPHIISLHDTVHSALLTDTTVKPPISEPRSALVFEYAPYNLAELLQFGPLPQNIARTLFQQLLQALDYLHSKNIIHRDIKPQNILFDQHFNLKVCDFGLSAQLAEGKPRTVCGSDSFKSPEMLMRKTYNGVMNDLFAAAVTLFILVAGQPPFLTAHPHTGLYKLIAMNYIDKFWQTHQKKHQFTQELKDLLTSMLAFDPTHRLTIAEIMQHPWMKGDVLMGDQLKTEMKKIEGEVVEKKRKAVLKALKNKQLKLNNNKAHRSLAQSVQLNKHLNKGNFNSILSKPTDRFVPTIQTYEQLEALLQLLEGDLTVNENGQIIFTKISQENSEHKEQQIKVEINVEYVSQECDCLRFKLKEGDAFQFNQALDIFDQAVTCEQ